MILHHAETWEGCQSMTHGDRRSIWAGGYYGAGYHRDDYTDESYARDEHAAGAPALITSYAKRRGE